jgi:protein-disulfide isomerase
MTPPTWQTITRGTADIVLLVLALGLGWQWLLAQRGTRQLVDGEEWQTTTRAAGVARGERVVVEFIDYQCPVCALQEVTWDGLAAGAPNLTRIVRHFPLPHNKFAFEAAVAVECATAQGQRIALHKVLLQSQDSIGKEPWSLLARRAGVADTAAFARCLDSEPAQATVKSDMALGASWGVRATPTYVVDREISVGLSPADLQSFVRRRLELPER